MLENDEVVGAPGTGSENKTTKLPTKILKISVKNIKTEVFIFQISSMGY